MHRHFVFCELLVVWGFLSPLAHGAPSTAQGQTVPISVLRAAPPAASATADELERNGDQLRSAESYLDALDYYRAALTKKPDSAPVYNKLGIVELQMERFKQARKDFEKSIKLDPTFPSTYNNLGAVYYGQGDYGAAIKQYKKAIKLEPNVATFYSNIGAAYFARKEYEPAGVNYARALELDPEVLERHSRTGVTAQLSSSEDHARYAFVMAKLYARSGAIDRALEYLKRAIKEGYAGIKEVYKDAAFAGLREDPRFADLMADKPSALPE